ncbi:MAG: rod shape-determining protein MreD [Anaerolineales bacterium]|nr:rod shape-determining protein MreD [Anaerolineales bacterium]
MTASIYLAIPLMIVLGVVETAVLPHFPVFGTTPQLALLVALAWGLLYGIEEGAVWAFFAGMFTDIFSITPVGISSMAFVVGITAVLWTKQAFPTSRVLMPLALAALATVISFLVNIVLLLLFGIIDNLQSISLLPTAILINVLAILPIYWLLYIIDRIVRPRRVQI